MEIRKEKETLARCVLTTFSQIISSNPNFFAVSVPSSSGLAFPVVRRLQWWGGGTGGGARERYRRRERKEREAGVQRWRDAGMEF